MGGFDYPASSLINSTAPSNGTGFKFHYILAALDCFSPV
jgi:hypothetical protein